MPIFVQIYLGLWYQFASGMFRFQRLLKLKKKNEQKIHKINKLDRTQNQNTAEMMEFLLNKMVK